MLFFTFGPPTKFPPGCAKALAGGGKWVEKDGSRWTTENADILAGGVAPNLWEPALGPFAGKYWVFWGAGCL